MNRKTAAAAGLLTYNTGKPCKHGHKAGRYTSTGVCKECNRLTSSAFRKDFKKNLVKRVKVSEWAHPDDTKALRDYAQKLREARETLTAAEEPNNGR